MKSLNLRREADEIRQEAMSAVQRVIDSGWYLGGREATEFEKEFSGYIGAKYAVGLNSGSDSLYLAIRMLGIGNGDEVITVSHTFVSSVDAVLRNGAQPVLVDIDPETYCIDAGKMKQAITRRTKAVIPVHLYGHPADMDAIVEVANEHQLTIIEDASQAHGSKYKGKRVGGIGRIGSFSLYPSKNLGAWGDAGAIVTDDEELAGRIRMCANYGQQMKHRSEFIGVNSRLDEIQAAILRIKLRHLDEWNNRRRKVAEEYSDALETSGLVLPTERQYALHVYHQYVVRSERRDYLMKALAERGIETSVHYPIPVHMQKSYLDLGYRFKLPVTENIVRTVLSLPINPQLTDTEITVVVSAVMDAAR